MKRNLLPVALLIASTALAGCVELPVVGNVGERVKPFLPDFIRERLFPADSAASGTKVAPVRNPRRRGRLVRRAASGAPGQETADGADTEETSHESEGVPRQSTAVLYEQFLTRNMEFDHLRTQGMEQLIGGQTEKAIASFKAALAKKPADRSVEDLLQLAEHPPVSKSLDGGAPISGNAPPGIVPGLPSRLPIE